MLACTGTLAYLSKDTDVEVLHRNLLISCLYALNNILLCKPVYHGPFFELQGKPLTLFDGCIV
jgi:hypothetical protein